MGFYILIAIVWLIIPLGLLFVIAKKHHSAISGFAVIGLLSYFLIFWFGTQIEGWQAGFGIAILGPLALVLVLATYFVTYLKAGLAYIAIAIIAYWVARRVLKTTIFNARTAIFWAILTTALIICSTEIFIETMMRQAAQKQFQTDKFSRHSAVEIFANTQREFRNSNGRLKHNGVSYIWSFRRMAWLKDCRTQNCTDEEKLQ